MYFDVLLESSKIYKEAGWEYNIYPENRLDRVDDIDVNIKTHGTFITFASIRRLIGKLFEFFKILRFKKSIRYLSSKLTDFEDMFNLYTASLRELNNKDINNKLINNFSNSINIISELKSSIQQYINLNNQFFSKKKIDSNLLKQKLEEIKNIIFNLLDSFLEAIFTDELMNINPYLPNSVLVAIFNHLKKTISFDIELKLNDIISLERFLQEFPGYIVKEKNQVKSVNKPKKKFDVEKIREELTKLQTSIKNFQDEESILEVLQSLSGIFKSLKFIKTYKATNIAISESNRLIQNFLPDREDMIEFLQLLENSSHAWTDHLLNFINNNSNINQFISETETLFNIINDFIKNITKRSKESYFRNIISTFLQEISPYLKETDQS